VGLQVRGLLVAVSQPTCTLCCLRSAASRHACMGRLWGNISDASMCLEVTTDGNLQQQHNKIGHLIACSRHMACTSCQRACQHWAPFVAALAACPQHIEWDPKWLVKVLLQHRQLQQHSNHHKEATKHRLHLPCARYASNCHSSR
jgi:hypothetical protein